MAIRRLLGESRRAWDSRSTGSYPSEAAGAGGAGASRSREGGTQADMTASWAMGSPTGRRRMNGTRRIPLRLSAGGSVVAAVALKNSLNACAGTRARIRGPHIRSLSGPGTLGQRALPWEPANRDVTVSHLGKLPGDPNVFLIQRGRDLIAFTGRHETVLVQAEPICPGPAVGCCWRLS